MTVWLFIIGFVVFLVVASITLLFSKKKTSSPHISLRGQKITRILRNIFLFSLPLYLISTFYTRLLDGNSYDPFLRIIYSMPCDAFPLKCAEHKDQVLMQMGILSTAEVAELFKFNPDTFPHVYTGMCLQNIEEPPTARDYVVLRFKNTDNSVWGDFKWYFSCFHYPITHYISAPFRMPTYYNIIIPYPKVTDKDSTLPCETCVRWRNFEGSP